MLSRRVAWSVALVATLTMAVSYVDRQAFATLSVKVTKDLHISETEYGWLLLAFNLAYLVATPLSGWWIDRVGARRGLVISVLVWSVIAGLHCFATGFVMLFALRIALGIAEGPSFPGSAQAVQRALPPQDRERGFGVLFTGSSLGGMVVPPLAAALFVAYGWRYAFVGIAAICLLWVPLWMGVTRQRGVPEALDRAVQASPQEPRATFAEIVRNPIMIRALLGVFAAAPVFGLVLGWGAKYLNRTFEVAQADVGHYLWLPPLAMDAGAILFGDLASRQRRRREAGAPARLLYACAIPLAACLGFLPLAASPWQAIAMMSMAMGGAGALYTLVTADLLSRMPPGSVSFASGIMSGAQSLALIIMNLLVGMLVDHYQSFDVPAHMLGLWVLPGSLAWLLWKPPLRFTFQRMPVARVVRTSSGGDGEDP